LLLDSTRKFSGSAGNRKCLDDVDTIFDIRERCVSQNTLVQVVSTSLDWFEGLFRDSGELLGLVPDVHILRIGER
jgi:hypothetical protein